MISPHQRVCRELVPEIYRCLHLFWMLSDGKLSSIPHYCALSNSSFCQASSCPKSRRKQFTPLLALLKRIEANTQLDTQEVLFNISDKVTDLR